MQQGCCPNIGGFGGQQNMGFGGQSSFGGNAGFPGFGGGGFC